jgi:DNA-binding protein YbaB
MGNVEQNSLDVKELMARIANETFEGECIEGVTAKVTYHGKVCGIEISETAFRTVGTEALGDVVARAVMSAMSAPNRWLLSQFAQLDTADFPLSKFTAAALSGDEGDALKIADQIARREV